MLEVLGLTDLIQTVHGMDLMDVVVEGMEVDEGTEMVVVEVEEVVLVALEELEVGFIYILSK